MSKSVKKSASSPAYPIESVGHALTLLRLFAERHRMRIAEIAAELAVAPSTASRLVAMLEQHGFVERDVKSPAYVVGTELRRLGIAAVSEVDVRAQVHPYLEALAEETGESAQFGILQEAMVVFLDCVEGGQYLRVSSRVGTVRPAHSLATGKALLAELSRDELLALYPRERLEDAGESAIKTRSQLERELAVVRSRGYATLLRENAADVYAVAAVVRDVGQRVRGAISLAAPHTRMKDRYVAKMTAALLRSAKAISGTLL